MLRTHRYSAVFPFPNNSWKALTSSALGALPPRKALPLREPSSSPAFLLTAPLVVTRPTQPWRSLLSAPNMSRNVFLSSSEGALPPRNVLPLSFPSRAAAFLETSAVDMFCCFF
eukprot:PhF_6_TR13037/c1_g1_i1/m.20697